MGRRGGGGGGRGKRARGAPAEERARHGETVPGRNPALEALRGARKVLRVYLDRAADRSAPPVREIVDEAARAGVEIVPASTERLDSMASGERHQGVVAVVEARGYVHVDDLLSAAKRRGEDPFIILLDGVEDPHNLGAVLRVADGAGAHGVVIPERNAAPLTAGAYKASAGAAEHVPVARVANLSEAVRRLKRADVWVGAAEATEGKAYWDEKLTGPLAVVMGSEGKGVSRLVRDECDFLVHIPMRGKVNSLNVSVATAVLSFERLRQQAHQHRSR